MCRMGSKRSFVVVSQKAIRLSIESMHAMHVQTSVAEIGPGARPMCCDQTLFSSAPLLAAPISRSQITILLGNNQEPPWPLPISGGFIPCGEAKVRCNSGFRQLPRAGGDVPTRRWNFMHSSLGNPAIWAIVGVRGFVAFRM